MPKEKTEAAGAPRVRKISIPLAEIIGLRDELIAIDVTAHDDAIKTAIDAVAEKLLSKVA